MVLWGATSERFALRRSATRRETGCRTTSGRVVVIRSPSRRFARSRPPSGCFAPKRRAQGRVAPKRATSGSDAYVRVVAGRDTRSSVASRGSTHRRKVVRRVAGGRKTIGGVARRDETSGASLRRADLVATDLSAAFLWRADFGATSKGDAAALAALRLPPAPDRWLPAWTKSGLERGEVPRGMSGYQDLRKAMDLIPAGLLRDKALDRIRRVYCDNPDSTLASCSPPVDDTSQQKSLEDARVDESTYAKSLSAVLKDLVCTGVDNGAFYFTGRMPMIRDSSAIYVLRGLMYPFCTPIFPDLGDWS